MFNLTPAATQELLAAAARSDAEGLALRIAARQIADGSIEFGMGFDEERADDVAAQFDALTVLIGSPSKPLLDDTVLDFVEIEPGRFGFVFMPSAAVDAAPAGGAACGSGGCGSCARG
jgi:iron-sulfur cluster assembly protein